MSILDDILEAFGDPAKKKLRAQSPEGQSFLDQMLAKAQQADLPQEAIDQNYSNLIFQHIGKPGLDKYDLNAPRMANAQAPVGMYTYADKAKSDQYLKNHSTWSDKPVAQTPVVTSGENVFVIGADKPTEGMRQSFIEAMERADRRGDKYANLLPHQKEYWDEKINKFMRFGDPTGLPISATDMNKIFTDNGYDMLLRNANEFVHLKPEQLRKPDAKFNPASKGKSGLNLGTAGVAAGAGLAAMQSEDAEASPFGDAMSTGQRMLQLGMIAPSTLDNPSALKSAVTKYTNYLKGSKAFREREYRAAESAKLLDFSQTDLGGRIVADLEKMIGKPIMPIRGDRSDLGALNSVNGIEVNTPVEAGSKFSQAHNADDRGWMSTYGVAVGVQNKIMKIADDLGVEPIAVYNAMGRDSINFSTPIAEAMFKQLDELPIAKKDIKAFDADMRKRYKEWVGLESESALDQLLGRGEFNMDGAGKMRTVFSTLMGMDKYQKRGFPSYDKLVDGLTDPALANVEKGDSGLSMYQTIANPVLRELGVHQSYDGVMPGNYIGGLPDDMSVPFEVMFPEIFKNTSKMVDKHGRPLSRDLQINTANMSSDGWQIADEAWFDGLQKYLKENPKSVGTGSAILGALSGNAMAGTEVPDYAAPMAVQAAGQSDLTGVANPGRDFGNIAVGIDMLLPLFMESIKPATMGNAELTEEQRKRGYYYGM